VEGYDIVLRFNDGLAAQSGGAIGLSANDDTTGDIVFFGVGADEGAAAQDALSLHDTQIVISLANDVYLPARGYYNGGGHLSIGLGINFPITNDVVMDPAGNLVYLTNATAVPVAHEMINDVDTGEMISVPYCLNTTALNDSAAVGTYSAYNTGTWSNGVASSSLQSLLGYKYVGVTNDRYLLVYLNNKSQCPIYAHSTTIKADWNLLGPDPVTYMALNATDWLASLTGRSTTETTVNYIYDSVGNRISELYNQSTPGFQTLQVYVTVDAYSAYWIRYTGGYPGSTTSKPFGGAENN